jgi:allantoate deiminase
MSASKKIMRRIEALAKISEEPGKITRTFASPAMRRANRMVAQWMREAGMKTRTDAIGNLIGHYDGNKPDAKLLLLGSHLDTVRNAGKFDGPLGVILAIACVEHLNHRNVRLPFAIEVIGFADEEGVRYQTTYLGSRALAGCFNQGDLRRCDAGGIMMADAIKRFGGNPAKLKAARLKPKQLVGYVEAHIEQGPTLEKEDLAVGVVNAIAGQTRVRVVFIGKAGHAGTTPMALRKDALCAAAEMILATESLARKTPGLMATVGEILARPGASNVIPGEAHLSLDIRHAKDSVRKTATLALATKFFKIAKLKNLKGVFTIVHETAAVKCSKELSALLTEAVRKRQKETIQLASGAGHDAAVMAGLTPSAMLFIRCKNGISHHPDESVKSADARAALEVMNDFLQLLAVKYPPIVGPSGRKLL